MELKKIARSSYNLSLTSDEMSAVNLLSELLDEPDVCKFMSITLMSLIVL